MSDAAMSKIDFTQAATVLDGVASPGDLAIELREAPLRGMITLRGDLEDAALAAAVKTATGVETPGVRKAALAEGRGALWMAPDELLLYVHYRDADAATARICEDLKDQHHLAVNVSDARTVLQLRGDGAREVIAKGSPVDLSRAAFGVGDLRRTRIAQTAAAYYQAEENPDLFEVICFRSYAKHLFNWFAQSAKRGSLPGVL